MSEASAARPRSHPAAAGRGVARPHRRPLEPRAARPPGRRRGLIVIGVLAAVTSVFGFIVSCTRTCCLTVYLTLGVLVTLAQAGFSLYLFIAPQDAVNKLLQNKPGNE